MAAARDAKENCGDEKVVTSAANLFTVRGMVTRILSELYQDSPRKNVEKLLNRLSGKTGAPPRPEPPKNKVLDPILRSKSLPLVLAHALKKRGAKQVTFAGEPDAAFSELPALLSADGRTVRLQNWSWNDSVNALKAEGDEIVVLTLLPSENDEWETVRRLKQALGTKLVLIFELLLPYTRVSYLQGKLDYFIQDLDRLLAIYLGELFYGQVDEVDKVVPFKGKSVIEFGPFDACQTAGMVNLGVGSLTCIEARPENLTKTRTACEVFGWDNVKVIMDDFHNADALKYGRFDLCFAHGVYYHSIAPFVFLENLRTLSDTIFLGGFCATDELPNSPYLELPYEGRTYKVKQYRESTNFTAGVNRYGYYFVKEDLIRFFEERGHKVQVVADQVKDQYAGKYLKLLITQ
jgi:hypothetical protein